jgi:2-succinyl-5-enolpyruvyl-6-hydroxy-3-cyclohexene-1-carboxylate synthase
MLQIANLNETLVYQILYEIKKAGVEDFVVCPGGRNTPIVNAINKFKTFNLHFWPEERSASFFALGKIKSKERPVVVCVTSGTAVAELLPAVMEAYYTDLPLILLTADRPRRFRGSGAPQSPEQVGLFGKYVGFEQDLEFEDQCSLKDWNLKKPAHINVCLEEPLESSFGSYEKLSDPDIFYSSKEVFNERVFDTLDQFVKKANKPLVIVSAIPENAKDSVVSFLSNYGAPIYLEAVSLLREHPSLQKLRIRRSEKIWQASANSDYKIDGILRIGSVPTLRMWRDLEDKSDIPVCSISHLPFSGLSYGKVEAVDLNQFFSQYELPQCRKFDFFHWLENDRKYQSEIENLFQLYPLSEAALVHELSKRVSSNAFVYLGNSLPIREWDAYADHYEKNLYVQANRGMNGIDGQISTFFGACSKSRSNWGIVGDLTAIYDLAAPWILKEMKEIDVNLVIINNGGGKIFHRLFPLKEIQNLHPFRFKSLAELWQISYETYTQIPNKIEDKGQRLIEIIPSEEETISFWDMLGKL